MGSFGRSSDWKKETATWYDGGEEAAGRRQSDHVLLMVDVHQNHCSLGPDGLGVMWTP